MYLLHIMLFILSRQTLNDPLYSLALLWFTSRCLFFIFSKIHTFSITFPNEDLYVAKENNSYLHSILILQRCTTVLIQILSFMNPEGLAVTVHKSVCSVRGIICPPGLNRVNLHGLNRVNWSAKFRGALGPPIATPLLLVLEKYFKKRKRRRR